MCLRLGNEDSADVCSTDANGIAYPIQYTMELVLLHHESRSIRHKYFRSWWRHQMETFSALLVICAGNSPVPGEFPAQRSVTRSFDVFFDLHPNKRLSKQWWGWWFETPPRPLWRHRNVDWRKKSHLFMTQQWPAGWSCIKRNIICGLNLTKWIEIESPILLLGARG